MKISQIRDVAPALELRKANPAGGADEEPNPVSAAQRGVTGGGIAENPTTATGPTAAPPLLDFQPSGVRNDHSIKYRRAELALEGTIYRLTQSRIALLNSMEEPGELVALPDNCNLQQTADAMAALAHAESVKFRNGS